ncbi:unnamed protein product [Paramecium sonneborni]|uniref:Uncharacterized protein n=1 Tax=Paramecium sonneborni TaxID=65129 RepID=A0A8S1M0S4_9CILI|nr:unnamed protein product [Paramecium sonneborni]
MDVNAILQERKRLRIQKEKIKQSQLQRKFRQKEKYYNQELTEKLGKDILAEKKQSFYQNLFASDQNNNREQEEIQLSQNQQQQKQQIKEKKKNKMERKQIKKVFTQKNAKGQPVLKNYLNLMIKKIEKEKLNKN